MTNIMSASDFHANGVNTSNKPANIMSASELHANGVNTSKKHDQAKSALLEKRAKNPILAWSKNVPGTELEKLKNLVSAKHNVSIDSYWDLHKWSVDHYKEFWDEIWTYFDVISSQKYTSAHEKTGPGFLDNKWFPGAKLNYAENMLRIRDNRVALICSSEESDEVESITYAELYEEVKLYASAFRKHGLKKNDRVACYMSNRKEAVYALLAVASIGAVWTGAQPFYGAKATGNIIQRVEPKMLIAVDRHQDTLKEYNLLSYLPTVVKNSSTLEKVIIVPTNENSLSKDIFHIPNSCFLHEFLAAGRRSDNSVPDLVFEQLPFDHPLFITFTSGTSALPKAPVHSAGVFLSLMVENAFHWNLQPGDTVFNMYPMGWSIWHFFIPCLSRGVKIFLYCGSPFCDRSDGLNIWEICAQNEIKHIYVVPSVTDRMEKFGFTLNPAMKYNNLQLVTIIGSPVKVQDIEYVLNKVKKDVLVGSLYGATELFADFSGFDLNLPCYAGEIQVPALSMDLHCYNKQGFSVIGEMGDVVIGKPTPAFPLRLWKDDDGQVLYETYLKQVPGLWYQNDECWINPTTRGIVVVGRSDDTMVQNGERFGASDVYFAIHDMEEILDYVCVGQKRFDGDERAVLFVQMKKGYQFTPELREKIILKIDDELWEDCVPNMILPIPDIPYNINGKKMESTVRKIIATNEIPEVNNIKNPECLTHYCNIPEILDYNKP